MTKLEWDAFARLYREVWKAHADLATLKTLFTTAEFAAQQNRADIAAKAIAGGQERLEKSRGKHFCAKYLNKCEAAHLASARRTF